MGFDPGSPGSRPGPKAGAKPLRHPGIPYLLFKIFYFHFFKDLFLFIYLFFFANTDFNRGDASSENILIAKNL